MAETQLALPFPVRQSLLAEDFLPHPGAALALEFLHRAESWPRRQLALWGERGVGKTHLAHVWAREHGAHLLHGAALHDPFWPESAVAIDDAEQAPSERALLHVLNAASEAKRPVLLTMRAAPGRIGWQLPDLASRLRAITAVEIGPGDDAFLAALLARLLSERQLAVSPSVQGWIMRRLPRRAACVREIVARLDDRSLAERKTVTQKYVESVLTELLDDATEVPP